MAEDLGAYVADDRGGLESGLSDQLPFHHGPSLPEVFTQRVGQAPGDRMRTVVGSVSGGCDQVGQLGFEPRGCLWQIAERCREGGVGRRWLRQPHRLRIQQPHGRVDPAQVPVQQPFHSRLAFHLAVVKVRALTRVHPQQVVHAVPVPAVWLHQVCVRQFAQRPSRILCLNVRQHRDARDADVRAWDQAQQPVQPLAVRGQAIIGVVEGHPDGRLGIVGDGQAVQPVLLLQFGQILGDRLVRPAGDVGRGDSQGQWQVAAHLCQRGHGLRLGRRPLRSDDVRQQQRRLAGVQDLQDQPVATVGGRQPGQPVTAGDDHHASLSAGQQRADLLGAVGVVQHHEDPLARQQRSVQPCGLLQFRRDLVSRDAQAAQKRGQRL